MEPLPLVVVCSWDKATTEGLTVEREGKPGVAAAHFRGGADVSHRSRSLGHPCSPVVPINLDPAARPFGACRFTAQGGHPRTRDRPSPETSTIGVKATRGQTVSHGRRFRISSRSRTAAKDRLGEGSGTSRQRFRRDGGAGGCLPQSVCAVARTAEMGTTKSPGTGAARHAVEVPSCRNHERRLPNHPHQ